MAKEYKPPYRKSPYKVRKALKELRELVDNHPDPVVQRVAYFGECILRWATEDTTGWKMPAQDATATAYLIKDKR